MYKLFCDYCEKEVRNSDGDETEAEWKLQIKESLITGKEKSLLDMDLCKGCTRKFLRLLVEVAGGNLDDVVVAGKLVK